MLAIFFNLISQKRKCHAEYCCFDSFTAELLRIECSCFQSIVVFKIHIIHKIFWIIVIFQKLRQTDFDSLS
jgi:hypothetical protein